MILANEFGRLTWKLLLPHFFVSCHFQTWQLQNAWPGCFSLCEKLSHFLTPENTGPSSRVYKYFGHLSMQAKHSGKPLFPLLRKLDTILGTNDHKLLQWHFSNIRDGAFSNSSVRTAKQIFQRKYQALCFSFPLWCLLFLLLAATTETILTV